MKYMGSKRRIAKFILPIMIKEATAKGISTWVEPFVGGANMIDRVPEAFNRIGSDYNDHAIEALIAVRDHVDELPTALSEAEYKQLKGSEPEPIKSWLRFTASFGSKFDGSYARNGGLPRYKNTPVQCGVNNAKKQSPKLQTVELKKGSYEDYSDYKGCLIYCDPPYQGTTFYKTGAFDHTSFWQWCREMSANNTVFVSEYNAPADFECVWEKKVTISLTNQTSSSKATEKLFKFAPVKQNRT
jgi:DNA adenine methylase